MENKKEKTTVAKLALLFAPISNYMLSNIRVKFKKSLVETYNYLIKNLVFSLLVCPNCKAKGSMRIHGYYNRHVLALLDDQLVHETLSILRLKCDSCDSTHAVLPDFIIPYCTYSYSLILDCLKSYFNKTKIIDLCDKYSISYQLLFSWVKRFKAHKNQCILLFKKGRLTLKEIMNMIFSYHELSNFLIIYFQEYLYSFMQIIKPPE